MKSASEITKEIERMMEFHPENPATPAVVQALGWVLGEELPPNEFLTNESDE